MKNRTQTRNRPPEPALSELLCFAVYSTNLAFGRFYKRLFEELGITYPQYATLVALIEGGDQTVGELGDKLFLESSTLTPLLKRLEATGLVTRRRDAEDERQVRVSLTPEGRATVETAFCGRDAVIDSVGLDTATLTRLQRDLLRLRDDLLAAAQR